MAAKKTTKQVTKSAKTGEFVETAKAKTSPKKTVTITAPLKSKGLRNATVVRDAGTGEFVEPSRAKTHPATTITQHVKGGKKKASKKEA